MFRKLNKNREPKVTHNGPANWTFNWPHGTGLGTYHWVDNKVLTGATKREASERMKKKLIPLMLKAQAKYFEERS